MPLPSYPILLDVTDGLCVIVGGGVVAVRKANGLIKSGATNVRMIAPMFAAEIPDTVHQIREAYRAEHLDGAKIVFATTNVSAVNDAVVRDAQARRILVNRADGDDELPGDFVSAARFDQGPVTVAVSAGSAALSVMIRDQLASQWQPGWTDLAEAMIELRPEIKKHWDEKTRQKIFRDLASPETMEILAGRGVDGLRLWILARFGEGT
jgi:siroheme synthase-like protein